MGSWLFSLILPVAYMFALAEIVSVNAKRRGRNGWQWSVFAIAAGLAAAFIGFLIAPLLAHLEPNPQKVGRVFLLCLWVPGIAASALAGALPTLLPSVTAEPARSAGHAFRAGDWYADGTCPACEFMIEKDDKLCECPHCSGVFHASCWENAMGCPRCAAVAESGD